VRPSARPLPSCASHPSPIRWKKSDENIWSCALHGRLISLRQDATHLYYRASLSQHTSPSASASIIPDDTKELLLHYLNLGLNLTELYEQWSSADANFKKKAPKFAGVRILRQDAWEALVGFICSSNNNIGRISQMVRLYDGRRAWRLC
jgi:N-glycosylase/DNA lyase